MVRGYHEAGVGNDGLSQPLLRFDLRTHIFTNLLMCYDYYPTGVSVASGGALLTVNYNDRFGELMSSLSLTAISFHKIVGLNQLPVVIIDVE
jgi:hypothetical protein